MQRIGIADLPLHGGSAPRWLFKRMVPLSRGIVAALIEERGSDELLRRLSDPFWFQALSCVIGFDWHSSGTTTVTCGAMKEALKDGGLGVVMAGGKGAASRKAPQEITRSSEDFGISGWKTERLVYSSRMSAKVDSAAVQDGHQLYHHAFFLNDKGNWTVIQQGMSPETGFARRYHWLHDRVQSFVVEPHFSIIGERAGEVLDMTAAASEDSRRASVDLVRDDPSGLQRRMRAVISPRQGTLDTWTGDSTVSMSLPADVNWETLRRLYDFQPRGYEELIAFKGVGPATVRALALISELIYGAEPSWRDPVKFTFAVGGKDGVPYPVDRRAMDETIEIMKKGVGEAKVGNRDKLDAIRRLRSVIPSELR